MFHFGVCRCQSVIHLVFPLFIHGLLLHFFWFWCFLLLWLNFLILAILLICLSFLLPLLGCSLLSCTFGFFLFNVINLGSSSLSGRNDFLLFALFFDWLLRSTKDHAFVFLSELESLSRPLHFQVFFEFLLSLQSFFISVFFKHIEESHSLLRPP